MPTYTPYPGPGRGISTAGINKSAGWKSSLTETGLNKTAGKSFSGLDVASNPIITSVSVGTVTDTSFIISWTTQIAQPLGSVTHRKAGTGNPTTVAETGSPPLTNHSVTVSGLTAATWYDCTVLQPATGGVNVGKQTISIRAGTTGAVGLEAQGAAPAPAGADGTGVSPTQPPPAPAPTPSLAGSEPGLEITSAQVIDITSTGATVTWRSSAYADGEVFLSGDGDDQVVEEGGSKRLNHNVVLTDLVPNTHYNVEVSSEDNNAEVGTATLEFDTLPE